MKIPLYQIALLMLLVQNVAAAPTNFSEYQQMPADQRKSLLVDRADPSHDQYVRWNWRLRVGEKVWRVKQEESLILHNGHSDIESLANYYALLERAYLNEEFGKSNPSPNSSQIAVLNDGIETIQRKCDETTHEVATLAPTEKSRLLNRRAEALLNEWITRYPTGKKWLIGTSAMNAVSAEYLSLTEQIKKLDKLASNEMQASIDNLPEIYPQFGDIRPSDR